MGVEDTALINTITSRIEPFMVFSDAEYQLGRYMFNSQVYVDYANGTMSSGLMYDEMFVVDQQIDHAFGGSPESLTASTQLGINVMEGLQKLLAGLPITYTIEPSAFRSVGSWPSGTYRGFIIDQYALDGDYLAPWFDNAGVMRFIRVFDPATAEVTFDFDDGFKVLRESPPSRTNDLIEAPNRIIIIGNGNATDGADVAIVGSYDIPASAPHSIANRGFVVPKVENRQISSVSQATAIARNIGLRQTIYERAEVDTAPDPRHDGYDVIRWRGVNWLETGWALQCREGSAMSHTLRRAYL